ncbi:3-dehydroquinate synthase [Fibrobacter sp. UWB4]|uniref:3-dehydroquinate synthase n=1 Tax=Fibrobacter sp. UWB4 TaxID=1964356 RepID=UPI000B5277BF|nr:3-dehydroquinate synthase [Fibrobacter sp. UWB4]MBO4829967.1 3-dehydroquinate synthase [Fibrobacter sp.]OWV19735.1 3-dehydroquinate synthase [Fibrobacter sp. UWB4]
MKKHLYFTGFMASGKSRTGRALADRLGRPFVDTDNVIVERAGKSINEIFEQEGEAAFRKMERDVIAEIAQSEKPLVVSLGGGALTQAENLKVIRENGTIIRLWAKPEVLSERIGRKNTRPLLANLSDEERLEKIKQMLKDREKNYANADFSVESSNDYSETHVTERIMHMLKFWESHALDVHPSEGGRYPIFIGKNIVPDAAIMLEGLRLAPTYEFLICTDTTIAKEQNTKLSELRGQAGRCPIFKFQAGEGHKTLHNLNQLYSFMLHRGYTRKSCLLQFSGGVVGDMAGFGAATYQRGIPFVQFPTTLLSMVDSSVGGKVAVNHAEGKNMIGAFYQPKAVVCDISVLNTLPPTEYLAGLAEIVKYGVIYDEEFFTYLENNVEKIKAHDFDVLKHMIFRSCQIKAEVVGIDEKEAGLRAILNYGHTFGHAIEKLTHYELYSHGIAVSLGMRVAARAAVLLGKLSKEDEQRQNKLLDDLGFPKTYNTDVEAAWAAMAVDKKAEKGTRVYILPTKIGKVEKVCNIDKGIIAEAWKAIQASEV